MTWYPNDRNIKFGTLLKEGSLHSPSFTKVLRPIFWFWYFEAVRFASRIFLHQSTTSYFILFLVLWSSQIRFANLPASKYYILFYFIFGTLKQSDLLRKSDCIKVLHPIFWSLVLWSSQICFTNLPASKYYILVFNFSTLEQSDSLRESSCTKVLHPIS